MNLSKLATHDFWEINGMFGRDNVIAFVEYDESNDLVYADPIFVDNLAQERIALSAINDNNWTPHQWVVSGGARLITGKTTDDIILNNYETIKAIPADVDHSNAMTLAQYPAHDNSAVALDGHRFHMVTGGQLPELETMPDVWANKVDELQSQFDSGEKVFHQVYSSAVLRSLITANEGRLSLGFDRWFFNRLYLTDVMPYSTYIKTITCEIFKLDSSKYETAHVMKLSYEVEGVQFVAYVMELQGY